MPKRKLGYRVTFLSCFMIMFILLGAVSPASLSSSSRTTNVNVAEVESIASTVYDTSWWNDNFHARIPVNLSDTYGVSRVNIPVDLQLSFDASECRNNSIRIVNQAGTEIPSQTWNRTYYTTTTFIKTATVTFYANVTASSDTIYWVYYTEQVVAAPSYTNQIAWGKAATGWYWFNGTYYAVATNYPAHSWEGISAGSVSGKIYYGTYWVDGVKYSYWGANGQSGLHWNPDSPTTSATPYSVSITESGPLFVTYKVIEPMGSNANATIWYRFFKWGWIGYSNVTFNGLTTSYSFRNNEYVFAQSNGANRMPSALWKLSTGQKVVSPSFTSSSQSIQHALWMGFYDATTGKSAGTVDLALDYSLASTPSWNYVMHGSTTYYNYWDRQFGSISVTSNSYIYEKYLLYFWDAKDGNTAFTAFANATERDHPLSIEYGEKQTFTFRVHVEDLAGENIRGANVTLYYTNGTRATGSHTGLTDANGNITLPGLNNLTYQIRVWKNSSYLTDKTIITTNQTLQAVTPGVKNVEVTLAYADLTIDVADLDGTAIKKAGTTNLLVRLYNSTGHLVHTTEVNAAGRIQVTRLPQDEYSVNFSYVDSSWFSYNYLEFSQAAQYLIHASRFTGDIQYTGGQKWLLPLASLNVTLLSDDDLPVGDANTYVTLQHQDYTIDDEVFPAVYKPVSDGQFVFYRILNGTWNIQARRVDSFGQQVTNNTVNVGLSANQSIVVRLGLTTLKIQVKDRDVHSNNIEGALVALYTASGSSTIATALTGSDGRTSFSWLKSGVYQINATVSGSATNTSSITAGHNYAATWILYMPPVTYTQEFTILLNNNQSSQAVVYFNDNITLSVTYMNRTSTGVDTFEDTGVVLDGSSWVNFTIYKGFSTTPIGVLYWSTSSAHFVFSNSSGQRVFNATLDTRTLGMYASATFYRVVVTAHTDGYTDPIAFTYIITVNVVPTEIVSLNDLNFVYGKGSNRFFIYNDTIHGLPIRGATQALYSITDTVYGSLSPVANGTYQLSAAVLNSLNSGTYSLHLTFSLSNYTYVSITIPFTVSERPTQASIVEQPTGFDWGATDTGTTVLYEETDLTSISAATVNITVMWLAQDAQNQNFNVTATTYLYDHTGMVAPNGTWRLRFVFDKFNFQQAITTTDPFTIACAPTEVVWGAEGNETTVVYSQEATLSLTYNRTAPAAGAEGAEILWTNWTTSCTLQDLNDGHYHLVFDTLIEAHNYTVMIRIGMENHSAILVSAQINILTPLALEAASGLSDQEPLPVYWTRNFTLEVLLTDLSHGDAPVSDALIYYLWNNTGVSGGLTENITVAGTYDEELAAHVVAPGLQTFVITAEKAGASDASLILYVRIDPNPTELNSSDSSYPEYSAFYEDVIAITYTWTDTLDNAPIITNNISAYLVSPRLSLPVIVADNHYTVMVNTTDLGLVTQVIYQVRFQVNMTGYTTPTEQTALLTLDPTLSQLVLQLDHAEIEENQYNQVRITANYSRVLSGTGITGANLTLTFDGQTITLLEEGNGFYAVNLTTTGVPRDTYQITVTANKPNYDEARESTNLIIVEPTIFIPFLGKIAISTFLSSTVTFTLPFLGFGMVVAYKRITMPYPLKVINQAIRVIQKGQQVSAEGLKLQNRAEMIHALLVDDYKDIAPFNLLTESSTEEVPRLPSQPIENA